MPHVIHYDKPNVILSATLLRCAACADASSHHPSYHALPSNPTHPMHGRTLAKVIICLSQHSQE